MLARAHKAYNEENFYQQLVKDLKAAKALVLIQSPFLAEKRLRLMEPIISECINRGVCVCVFLQNPEKGRNDPTYDSRLAEFQKLVTALESMGAHVTVRNHRHEKFVIIDDRIVWEGSLNVLSQNKTFEHMRRWVDRQTVREIIIKYQLNACETCMAARHGKKILGEDHSAPSQMQLLGIQIAQYRKAEHLSQAMLAKLAGVQQSDISDLERGKGNINLLRVLRICRALGLELCIVPWYKSPALYQRLRDAGLEL